MAGTEWADEPVEKVLASLEKLPTDQQGPFRNNGGGHANHTLFWESMKPGGGGDPSGDLAAAITTAFGSLDDFRAQFEANGVGQFGSGWTWLVIDDGKLKLTKTANQDSPILEGQTPLLGNDVWEHGILHRLGRAPSEGRARGHLVRRSLSGDESAIKWW